MKLDCNKLSGALVISSDLEGLGAAIEASMVQTSLSAVVFHTSPYTFFFLSTCISNDPGLELFVGLLKS